MARPKDQAARRAHLIDASMKAVLERGVAGARLRDIAEQAGVTPASVLYYYPDLQELFTAALERGQTAYCLHREQEIAEASGVPGQLRACIRSGVPWPGQAEQASRLLYEMFPVALHHEVAAEQQRRFVTRQTVLYQEVLERGEESGDFRLTAPAPVLARSFVALEDGYCFDFLVGSATPGEIEECLLLHARTVTGHPLS